MTAPLCPRDATPLTPTADVFGPGTRAHVCGKCTGVLVDWDTGQKFFTSLGLSLSDLQTMVAQAAGKQAAPAPPLTCTSCGKGAMKPLLHKGIELDLCEACGAAWFDRGELKRVTGGKLGGGLEAKAQPVAGETSKVVGVFEMFWDCAYCDTKALLGKSNRFCPGCGAQQDASRRYFPPPGKEVAANHEYDGADKSCPACQTPNGAKAHNCRSCGSPLDGSAEVNRVADRSSAAPQAPQMAAAKKKSKLPWIIGGVITVLVAFCLVAMFWTRDVGVTVTAHSWERTIDVEKMTAVSESAWCDSMPSGAYSVSRSREQRSTRKIPDGETCTTRDVDRGDGTFERKQECRTKYREEAIYDDRCRFTIDRWKVSRTARAAGQGTQPAPHWPPVNLARTGTSLGAEREGSRNEKYTLALMGDDKKPYTCTVPAATWGAIADGHKKIIPIGVITGAAECDKL